MTQLSTVPALQGISHLALSVDDLPAAIRFWTDVMGFEVTTETPTLGFFVDRPSRIAVAVTTGDGRPGGGFDERRCGLDHLALAVESAATLERWQRRLAEHDVPYSPITDSGSGLHLNLRAPDSIPIELYVINEATAAAFGLDGPDEAYAH